MSYYGGRFPIAGNLQQIVSYEVQSALQSSGWSLPCQVKEVSSDGLFVTVSIAVRNLSGLFQQITIPVMQSQYVRLPIQVGDVGITRKADISLYQISGIISGGGNPNFGQDGNYEAILAFEPISTRGNNVSSGSEEIGIKAFPTSPDINMTWIYGPDGAIIQDLTIDNNGNQVVNGKIIINNQGVTIQDITTSGSSQTVNSSVAVSSSGVRLQSGSSYIQINKNGSIDIEGTSVTIMGKDFIGHHHTGVQTGTSQTGGVA